MAQIIVIYDPSMMVITVPKEISESRGIKEARLTLAEDYNYDNIYVTARKLTELLMEQLK